MKEPAEDPNEEYFPLSGNMVSECCGDAPWGDIDEHNCGICSNCHEHCGFEKDKDEE